MYTSSTTIWLYSHSFIPLAVFGTSGGEADAVRLRYANTINAPGALELVLRRDQVDPLVIQPDYMLVITRSADGRDVEQVEGECAWIVRSIDEYVSDGMIVVTAESTLGLIDQREVSYDLSDEEAQRIGAADTEIMGMINENASFGTGSATRTFPLDYFFVESAPGFGPTITAEVNRKSLLQACQDIISDVARKYNFLIALDVVWEPGPQPTITWHNNPVLLARTYLGTRGTDRAKPGPSQFVLTEATLTNIVIRRDYTTERTVVTALGRGGGGGNATRPSETATNPEALYRSLWSRREANTYSQAADTDGILADAYRELYERRARVAIQADIIETPDARYGIDWDWGTRLIVQVGHHRFVAHIDTRMVEISDGQERIVAQIRLEN